jgi:hypothetical protein
MRLHGVEEALESTVRSGREGCLNVRALTVVNSLSPPLKLRMVTVNASNAPNAPRVFGLFSR